MRLFVTLSLAVAAYSQASCSAYCASVVTNCVGAQLIYQGADATEQTAACMAECAFFPMGDGVNNASATGNTLGCREYHASTPAAGANPVTHCPHARPDSTFCTSDAARALNMTSGTCDNFCDNLPTTCTGDLLSADRGACLRACARWTDQASPAGMYPLAAATGSTLMCRRYHLQVARAPAANAEHCPHADLLGGGVCGTQVAAFCEQAVAACPATITGFADIATCTAVWPNIPVGMSNNTMGDTQGCRAYHLSVALQSDAMATTHCPHIGQQGNGACGTICDAYCSQYAARCNGITGATQYADMATCRTACGAMTRNNAAIVTSGDSLDCRFYHLRVAQTTTAAQTEHCPHARQMNSAACAAAGPAPTPSSAASTAISAVVVAVPALFAFL